MIRQFILLPILVLAMTGQGCVTFVGNPITTPTRNPFQVPEDEFYAKVKTIAVELERVPPRLDFFSTTQIQQSLKKRLVNFVPLIESRLREGGFSVVPWRKVEEIQTRLKEQFLTDIDYDSEGKKMYVAHYEKELQIGHNTDTRLEISLTREDSKGTTSDVVLILIGDLHGKLLYRSQVGFFDPLPWPQKVDMIKVFKTPLTPC